MQDLTGIYRAFLQETLGETEMLPEDDALRQEDLPMLLLICK